MIWLEIIQEIVSWFQSILLFSICLYCLAKYHQDGYIKSKMIFLKSLGYYVLVAFFVWLPITKKPNAPIELLCVLVIGLVVFVIASIYGKSKNKKEIKLVWLLWSQILISSFFLPFTITTPMLPWIVKGGIVSAAILIVPSLILLIIGFSEKNKNRKKAFVISILPCLIGAVVAFNFVSIPEAKNQKTAFFEYNKPAGWLVLEHSDLDKFTISYTGLHTLSSIMSRGVYPSIFIVNVETPERYQRLKDFSRAMLYVDGANIEENILTIDRINFTRLSYSGLKAFPEFEAVDVLIEINTHIAYNDDMLTMIIYYGTDKIEKDFNAFFNSLQWLIK